MSLKVLVVPDKFKGTLTAAAAAKAIVSGWQAVRPQDEMEMLPMSDGGDGFGEIVANLAGATEQVCATVDAAGRPVGSKWWWHVESQTAVIESAQIVGLAMLPPGRYHPFDLDTRGLGTVIQAAVAAGARQVLMGIGGSATNDAGFGLASALGWRFLDDQGQAIERWVECNRLARWEKPQEPIRGVDFTVAVDVDNPLLGPNGCTRVYGPQKGVKPEQAPNAEAALEKLAAQAREQFGHKIDDDSGCGAAGGLGFGMRVFLGARLESGFEIYSRHAQLTERMSRADLILTGEGMIDRQSLMGKGTGRLAQLSKAMGKRCVGLAGMIEEAARSQTSGSIFHAVHAIAPEVTTPTEAKKDAALWLERLAQKVARYYN